jgi:uncharacterized alkaline shock family protein YloU
MEIISFSGKSGTGKSYHANKVCRDLGIDAIIDDGLLIYKNRVVAGASAKKCESKARAMRTTLFDYDDQRRDVQNKLKELDPDKLMIIGTSDRMTDWIANTLEIPKPEKHIYIEDVTTEAEREIASRSRNERGEHVIPAPMGELTRDFAGYFMHPLRLLRNMRMDEPARPYERTVVRPAYSYYGSYNISEGVIEDIILITAEPFRDRIKVTNFFNNGDPQNLMLEIELKIRRVPTVMSDCEKMQSEVKHMVEYMTAFPVKEVDIIIKDVVLEREIAESRLLRKKLERRGIRIPR